MTFDCHASDLRPVPVALQVEITPDEWVSSRANGSNDTEETPLTPMLEGTDATEHVRSGESWKRMAWWFSTANWWCYTSMMIPSNIYQEY